MIKLCAALLTASALLGCSVHSQAPIREVAYDFSDRDFYDRSYAPSPDYGEAADDRQPEVVLADADTEARARPARDRGAARPRSNGSVLGHR